MSFIKKFKTFLGKINIDFETYANCTISGKDGNEYSMAQIDAEKIKSFDWAYFLAQKNELVLLDNRQDTMESIETFERYKNGILGKLGKYYKEEIKEADAGRFEYAKDIYYLIRDICGDIKYRFKEIYPMYIEDGSTDNFLICMFTRDKKYNVDKMSKLAKQLGLYVFYIDCFFPQRAVKPLSCKDCRGDGILIQKNAYKEDRNASLIAELKAKQREKREKQMNFVMSQEDDEKFTQKAKKAYDAIKGYGLEGIGKDKPELQIESFLIDVFKVLLYKKWATQKDIVELEEEGYFFHTYEDGYEIPSKQDMIFDILDRIEEKRS
ncbi:MAG: hypothetical protein K2M95_00495 [Clostridiales bacterium]|nr:hypothetical protein [Clostridiales bacterium]